MTLNINKLATEMGDGTFTIRTDGLSARRQAEIEVVGVPAALVELGASLIDLAVEGVIERGARLLADQNVGVPLSIDGDDDIPPLFLGVRTVAVESGKRGLFAALRGDKGVLRLVDMFDPADPVPRTPLASMLLYRANGRAVTGDVPGAIADLEAAIALVPAQRCSEPIPEIGLDVANLAVNWKNHLAYLRLAELVDESRRSELLQTAYREFEFIAHAELGATAGELAALDETELVAVAKRIIAHNLAHPMLEPGPSSALRFAGSPLWTFEAGSRVRKICLLPAAIADYYYGGTLADTAAADAAAQLAAACAYRFRTEPWQLAKLTAGVRELYIAADAPSVETFDASHPGETVVSLLLAEIARLLHAGASLEQVRVALGLSEDVAQREALDQMLAMLAARETEQFMRALSM